MKGCHSLCEHFNPTNKNHGDINEIDSHVGDLGNLKIMKNGKCKCVYIFKLS